VELFPSGDDTPGAASVDVRTLVIINPVRSFRGPPAIEEEDDYAILTDHFDDMLRDCGGEAEQSEDFQPDHQHRSEAQQENDADVHGRHQ
jgi:hypothetical protein